jgi:hypothetical protein
LRRPPKYRDDLNYIFQAMLSEITSSHLHWGAGTLPRGVGLDPNGANARDVVVVPVASEQALRNLAWVESSVCRLGFVQGRLSVAISVGENRDSYSPTLPPGFYEATDSRTT